MTTYFFYDPQGRVIAEYEGTTPELVREYVWGNGQTEILTMFLPEYEGDTEDWDAFMEFVDAWLCEDPNACYDPDYDHNNDDIVNLADFAYFASVWDIPPFDESHFYYLHDALGSVRGLVGGIYNREDDREFYNYDVYGRLSIVNPEESTSGNPYLFAGYRYDAETSLYHTDNRTYDPETARWLQFDPIGTADSMNLYEYALSSPTNFIDPLGLWSYQGMYQSFLQKYGQEGMDLLDEAQRRGYMPVGYPDEDLGWDDYQWDGNLLMLPETWWGGLDDSDDQAARQLHKALDERIKLGGKLLQCLCENASMAGQAYQAGRNGLGDLPEVQEFSRAYEQQMNLAGEMGSSLQRYAEEEAKSYLLMVVGYKCAGKALEELSDAANDARKARIAAKGTLRNGHLAGKRHPKTGVPFNKNGYPDFSDHLYQGGANDLRITPTGNYRKDFDAANKAAGYSSTPEGYTWHHHQDTGRMQLVNEKVHSKTGHTGGMKLNN